MYYFDVYFLDELFYRYNSLNELLFLEITHFNVKFHHKQSIIYFLTFIITLLYLTIFFNYRASESLFPLNNKL